MHITAHALRLARVLTAARIPVQLAQLSIDFHLVSCHDSYFRKCLQVMTTNTTNLVVDHGGESSGGQNTPIDAHGQNRFRRIRVIIAAIAGIKNIHTLNVGGMFRVFSYPINRAEVWRGLFEDFLWRDEPIQVLQFRAGGEWPMRFTTTDGYSITSAAAKWRQINPQKTLRLRHLDIHFDRSDMDVIRAFLSAFGAVEKVALECGHRGPSPELSSDIVLALFQLQGLQSISLEGFTIPTMDVFNPSIPDSRFQNKPVLRELKLDRISLEDAASLPRFLEQLKQTPGMPSQLTDTMEYLEIRTNNRPPIFETDDFVLLDDVLISNKTLRYIGIVVPTVEPAYGYVLPRIHRRHSGRALLASEADRKSKIAFARKMAFLSTIGDEHGTAARRHLDSTIVGNIFAFSAPHATRTTSSDGTY